MSKITICVVGVGGVGKSSVSLRLVQNKFVDDYDPTIEDSYRKQVSVDKKSVVLDILDTAGQEMFSSYRDSYYKNAQGYLLVYSVTSSNSLSETGKFWESICRAKDATKVPAVLIGNKIDLDRVVPKSDGEALASKLEAPFFETSAKTNVNVEECFFELVRQVRKFQKESKKGGGSGGEKKGGCNIL